MKTKKSTGLVIVCILLAAVLALSVFALVSTRNQLIALEAENAALEEEIHALKAQIENMSIAQNWLPEEAYCTLVVANWSVADNVLTAAIDAGLMSDKPLSVVNDLLENAKKTAYTLGVGKDIDPFMTLSFMSLPVIPTLRLTTRGVVDVITQQYI